MRLVSNPASTDLIVVSAAKQQATKAQPEDLEESISLSSSDRHAPRLSGNGWCVLFGLQLRRFLVQHAQTNLLRAMVVRLGVGLLMGAAW